MVDRSLKRSATIGGSALLGLAAASCSLAFDLGREQCETAEDCTALSPGTTCENKVCVAIQATGGGGAGGSSSGGGGQGQGGEDPLWGCIDDFVSPVMSTSEMITYHYRIELAVNPGQPPPGMMVELCGLLDFTCANPFTIDEVDTDNGNVTFTLTADTEAFLKIDGTDLKPSRAYLPTPPVVLPPKEKVIRVVREEEFANIVLTSGKTYDPTRGTVIMLTVDCNDDRAAGVQLASDEVDADTIPYYFKGQLPNFTVLETDLQGAGGWVNLPVGLINARATRSGSGEAIGSASFSSRAGELAYVPIGPTPGAQ